MPNKNSEKIPLYYYLSNDNKNYLQRLDKAFHYKIGYLWVHFHIFLISTGNRPIPFDQSH